ncbi:MAG: cyclopropane-fatty-acyl-phospholipid synthase family protein [Pseudomonadota bacterium]
MSGIALAEKGLVPDRLIRMGINRLNRRRLKNEHVDDAVARHARFVEVLKLLRESPVAIHTDEANEQHYEVPPAFFLAALGARLKYSSCYYPTGTESLDEAEEAMLALTCERAELGGSQQILELGCGWGSLTLWMAEHYPESTITAVSNSAPQREFILARAAERGLNNVEVITANVVELELDRTFDRVVSVEMFEHMRNYHKLLSKVARWLNPGGKLFVHIFCHREMMYPFEVEGKDDWMGRFFFTGGLMPAADTLLYFQDDLKIEEHWRLSGRHYEATSNHWLENLDANRPAIEQLFADVYGQENARLWVQRWRIFFMACAELFGFNGGQEWLVGHYRFVRSA